MNPVLRASLAELLGTFTLTFIGAGAILATGGQNLVAIALAHGLALAMAVYATKGHINPAVTLAVFARKGIDARGVEISILKKLSDWQDAMTTVFRELRRVLVPGGYVAFEVGEVRGGKIRLDEAVIPCGVSAGLSPQFVLVNEQMFTKTANCWGVSNGEKGTNTNRIVVFSKET